MPSKDRRLTEKALLRQTILESAKDIAASDGWQNVTIRKICSKIKYTAPVVYQHFENKDSILHAIRNEGIFQMYIELKSIHEKVANPQKRLEAFGMAFWKFAQLHPELYQVMFNLQGVVCCTENNSSPLDDIIGYYKNAIQQLHPRKKYSNTELMVLIDHYIAIIHGIISLNMVNKIRSGKGELVLKQSLNHFIKSI